MADINMGETKVTKVYFLSSWGDPYEKLIERYRFQTPGHDGVWGELSACSDPAKADVFIVLQGLPKGAPSPDGPVIFFQREPREFKKPKYDHPALFKGFYPEHHHLCTWQIRKPFKELETLRIPTTWKGKISVVMSNKKLFGSQKCRLKFLERLTSKYPQLIDVYGRGLSSKRFGPRSMGPLNHDKYCKFPGMYEYRYSLACENSQHPNYFTEKLVDCFLTWSKPIYWGCPNVGDFFPKGSFVWLDITKADRAIDQLVEEVEKPVDYDLLKEARNLVLHKYNLWPAVEQVLKRVGL